MSIIDVYGLSESSSHTEGNLVTLVKVINVEVITSNKLRVYFDRNMKNDENLVNRLYYTIVPVTSGAVSCYISEIKIPYVSYPEYVDLITSEMTNGSTYDVYVDSDGPTDVDEVPVDPSNNSQSFVAVGVIPTIDRIIAISENRVDVVFTENMRINKAIKDSTKYSFDNGLSVLSVISVEGDTVSLATTDQVPNIEYTLTINP